MLQINTNKETFIQLIQKQFNTCYPYLKIEFFNYAAHTKPFMKADMLASAASLSPIASIYQGDPVNLGKNRTVGEITHDFENKFGLSAHVFRKSGNVWVETSLTEDWTLENQNKEGEQISNHFEK